MYSVKLLSHHSEVYFTNGKYIHPETVDPVIFTCFMSLKC